MSQYANEVNDIIGIGNDKEKKAIKSERAKLSAEIADEKRKKTNLVQKTLAAKIAEMGAAGSSGKSASDQAVLKRIAEEAAEASDETIANKESQLSKLKYKKNARAKNLLKSLLGRLQTSILE